MGVQSRTRLIQPEWVFSLYHSRSSTVSCSLDRASSLLDIVPLAFSIFFPAWDTADPKVLWCLSQHLYSIMISDWPCACHLASVYVLQRGALAIEFAMRSPCRSQEWNALFRDFLLLHLGMHWS